MKNTEKRFVTWWHPVYGPARVRYHGPSRRKGYSWVGNQPREEVLTSQLKFDQGFAGELTGSGDYKIKDNMIGVAKIRQKKHESKSYLGALAQRLLREDGEQQNVPEQQTGDSLDAQVDRYLSDYEATSRTAKHEARNFRMTIRRLMSEADEDEEGGDEPAETETTPATQPTKPSADSIDIEEFANNVARLIENYDSLLEVRSTLIKRSMNFISKNYDQTVVDALEAALRDKHGMVDGETRQEVEDEQFAAPPAANAGPGGAGA